MVSRIRNSTGVLNSPRSLSKMKGLKSNGSLKVDLTNVEGVIDHTEELEAFKKKAMQ